MIRRRKRGWTAEGLESMQAVAAQALVSASVSAQAVREAWPSCAPTKVYATCP